VLPEAKLFFGIIFCELKIKKSHLQGKSNRESGEMTRLQTDVKKHRIFPDKSKNCSYKK
jgi:hypothetical protein